MIQRKFYNRLWTGYVSPFLSNTIPLCSCGRNTSIKTLLLYWPLQQTLAKFWANIEPMVPGNRELPGHVCPVSTWNYWYGPRSRVAIVKELYSVPRHTRGIEPMSGQCLPTVYDVGPTLTRHWFNVSCLLRNFTAPVSHNAPLSAL